MSDFLAVSSDAEERRALVDAEVSCTTVWLHDFVPMSLKTSMFTLSTTRLADIPCAVHEPTSRVFIACSLPNSEFDNIVALDLSSSA